MLNFRHLLAALLAATALPTTSLGQEDGGRRDGLLKDFPDPRVSPFGRGGLLPEKPVNSAEDADALQEARKQRERIRRTIAANPGITWSPDSVYELKLPQEAPLQPAGVESTLQGGMVEIDDLAEPIEMVRIVIDLSSKADPRVTRFQFGDPDEEDLNSILRRAAYVELEVRLDGIPQEFEAQQRANLKHFRETRQCGRELGQTLIGRWSVLSRSRARMREVKPCSELPEALGPGRRKIKPESVIEAPSHGLRSGDVVSETWRCSSTTVRIKIEGLTREVTFNLPVSCG